MRSIKKMVRSVSPAAYSTLKKTFSNSKVTKTTTDEESEELPFDLRDVDIEKVIIVIIIFLS